MGAGTSSRAATRAQELADYIDHHHPKLGSALMKLRWGGLRTVEPAPPLLAAVVGAGVGVAAGARRAGGRRSNGRARVPLAPAGLVGTALAWLALWRWDAARWRRGHVMLVVDLPEPRLDGLVARLVDDGVAVERWERPRLADGPDRGVSCRLRDLRRVNAAIDDEISGGSR